MFLRYLIPHGVIYGAAFWKRFRALGLPGHYAFQRKYRNALDVSNLELIPASIRDSMSCVVDVGANSGSWCISIGLLTKARRIIAYEPVAETYRRLEANTRHYRQIECRNLAVGSAVGRVELYVERMSELSSVLPLRNEMRAVHGLRPGETIRVAAPLTTLDEDLKDCREVSLLKMDIQGYEAEALAGGKSILKRTLALLIEVTYAPYYQGDSQFDELFRLITAISTFRLWGISPPHYSPSGRPLWADAVFVRADYGQEVSLAQR